MWQSRGYVEVSGLSVISIGLESCSVDRTSVGGKKGQVTFRVTLLLVAQQRRASLQRASVAGVPYLLALSKSSLNGVLRG